MNFAYLKNAPDFAQLYTYCCEAEEFALSKPNISVTSARKAMEFIVKMIDDPSFSSYHMTLGVRLIERDSTRCG